MNGHKTTKGATICRWINLKRETMVVRWYMGAYDGEEQKAEGVCIVKRHAEGVVDKVQHQSTDRIIRGVIQRSLRDQHPIEGRQSLMVGSICNPCRPRGIFTL